MQRLLDNPLGGAFPFVAEEAPPQRLTHTRNHRILMVTARYLPSSGGTEMHVAEVSRRLAAAGHYVGILTADPSGELPAKEVVDGVHIQRVKAWPKNRDYFFAPAMYREIAADRWDLIHIQGYHTLFAPTAMMVAIAKKIPFVITFHSGGHSSPMRSRFRPLQMSLLGPLVSRAEQCIGVSRFEADLFAEGMGIDRRRFVVINNGAELPKPASPAAPANCRPLIVSIGRLEKYKGHQRAIEALCYLKDVIPDVRLQILGTGPYEGELRQLVEDRGLAGRVSVGSIPGGDRQALSDLVGQAKLVVLLSDYEANPVGVMEALSLGRPVLTTDCSGFMELHEQGLLNVVPLDADARSIAAAMADQMTSNGRPPEFVLPGWQECSDRLLEVYDGVLAARRRAG